MRRFAFLALPFVVLAGCASDAPAPATTASPDKMGGASNPKVAESTDAPGVQVPPMMRQQPNPADLEKMTKELDGLKTDYDTAKAAYEKNPKDKKVQDAFVTAAVKYGHESMVSPVLEAKVKYRQALGIYREVLKIDPNNEVAKPETDMIVSIYKQMNRPVPQ